MVKKYPGSKNMRNDSESLNSYFGLKKKIETLEITNV